MRPFAEMLNTANSTEQSVKSAGVEVPLMIARGDGGVMEISEMKKTSGPYDVVRSCSFCDGKSDVSACLKWCIF